jgi:hypothetical protein
MRKLLFAWAGLEPSSFFLIYASGIVGIIGVSHHTLLMINDDGGIWGVYL